MPKPTIYLDTSFISAFWYDGDHLAMAARRFHTREWWSLERKYFRIFGSIYVEGELRQGVFPHQSKCIKMANRLPYLASSLAQKDFIEDLFRLHIVPREKMADAAHLALATLARIDYLLNWNYAHLANPMVQAKLDELCAERELVAPLLVSPESMPQKRFGQLVRRRRK
jgi:hypothetical protein